MDSLLKGMAQKIPEGIRKMILAEGFIDKAVNSDVKNTPMEYLFDVYEEFLDPTGEHDSWECTKCREYILQSFRRMKPFIIQLNGMIST